MPVPLPRQAAPAIHLDVERGAVLQPRHLRGLRFRLSSCRQPSCLTDATTGLIDCGNWGVSASWTVPATAVSGVYLAHLVRNDNGGGSDVPFVVRNEVRCTTPFPIAGPAGSTGHSPQSVIGREARIQILQKEGRLPDVLVACVNGGSNAIGLFYPFLKDIAVRMIGVEAAGLPHLYVSRRAARQSARR